MLRPRFAWPLIATRVVCVLSLLSTVSLVLFTQPALLILLQDGGGSLGERLRLLSPLASLYLFGVFTCIGLVRICARRSRQTARLFLFVLPLLLALAFPLAWASAGMHSPWRVLWFALLVGLFFSLGRDCAILDARRRGAAALFLAA